jgi:hypothetical protein
MPLNPNTLPIPMGCYSPYPPRRFAFCHRLRLAGREKIFDRRGSGRVGTGQGAANEVKVNALGADGRIFLLADFSAQSTGKLPRPVALH